MLEEPRCWTRRCRHFGGVPWLGKDESSERPVCPAFPKGIPDEIAYGDDPHTEPIQGQLGDYVYQEAMPLR